MENENFFEADNCQPSWILKILLKSELHVPNSSVFFSQNILLEVNTVNL